MLDGRGSKREGGKGRERWRGRTRAAPATGMVVELPFIGHIDNTSDRAYSIPNTNATESMGRRAKVSVIGEQTKC